MARRRHCEPRARPGATLLSRRVSVPRDGCARACGPVVAVTPDELGDQRHDCDTKGELAQHAKGGQQAAKALAEEVQKCGADEQADAERALPQTVASATD